MIAYIPVLRYWPNEYDGELEDTGKIKEVKTNYAKAVTQVEFNPDEISDEEIIAVIKSAGYDAIVRN